MRRLIRETSSPRHPGISLGPAHNDLVVCLANDQPGPFTVTTPGTHRGVRAYRSHVSGAVSSEAEHRRDCDPDRSVVGVWLATLAALPALATEVPASRLRHLYDTAPISHHLPRT